MMIHTAVALATKAHDGQYRKCGVLPYIVHPMAVMKRLATWGVRNENILSAAILHDTLEDTTLTLDTIRESAGDAVAGLVEELTCRGNKAEYLASFATKSTAALLIKVADRLCNVRDFMPTPYATIYYNKAARLWETFRVSPCPYEDDTVWANAWDAIAGMQEELG